MRNSLNKDILNIIDEFCRSSNTRKKSKDFFKDFITYFYSKIEDKIKQNKQQSIKDKYIKIRQSALQYIIVNKNIITIELCKKRNNNK